MKKTLLAVCLAVAMIAFLSPPASAEAQSSVNAGVKGLIGPDLSAFVLLAEYERLVGPKLSVLGRVGYLDYSFDDGTYKEDGNGPGVEFGVRFYPKGGMKGFYVGGNAGFWWTDWDWTDNSEPPPFRSGSGSSTAFDIGVEVGGRIPLGNEKIVLIPNAQIGNFFSVTSDSNYANGAPASKETEVGFYALVGLSVGFSF